VPDDNYWTKTAYRIPDAPFADVKPGEAGVPTVPINRMVPRSFVTNIRVGQHMAAGVVTPVRGIAFGGDCGVRSVELSIDGSKTWQSAALGEDHGDYSFREWQSSVVLPTKGPNLLQVRCTNTNGNVQPSRANWNPAGFMRNVVEETTVIGT
jgi:Mo-co oxidoreductase dimerisation domain